MLQFEIGNKVKIIQGIGCINTGERGKVVETRENSQEYLLALNGRNAFYWIKEDLLAHDSAENFKKDEIVEICNKTFVAKFHSGIAIVDSHTIGGGLRLKAYDNKLLTTTICKDEISCIKRQSCFVASKWTISPDLLSNTTYEIQKNNQEEKKMDCNKILEKWLDLNIAKLEVDSRLAIEKEYDNDKVIQEYDATLVVINHIFGEFCDKFELQDKTIPMMLDRKCLATDETKNGIVILKEEKEKQIRLLKSEVEEIKAAASICTSEESLRKLLKNYDVIDKCGKIKLK